MNNSCNLKQLTVAIDFHAVEVNGYRQLFGYQTSSLVFNSWEKLTQA